MRLITESITLEEFTVSNLYLLIDPCTKQLLCMELVKLDRVVDAWYCCTKQRPIKYIRLINVPTIVVDSKEGMLHRIQTKQFNIR